LRGAGSVLLVFHLLAMLGSVLIGSPVGDAIRQVTRPYEHLLGVYQGWNMFAPNAPRSTQWMEVTAQVNGAFAPEDVASMSGRPSPLVKWTYSRRSKFERQLLDGGKRSLRAGLARWLCRSTEAELGQVSHVELWRVSMATPTPVERAPGATWEETRTLLERWPCP
jgi:hypothetical protein